MTKSCTTMMKIDSQSMAVAPQWGEIYSKGAISIFTCKYGHLWQPIFSLFEYERFCQWEPIVMKSCTTMMKIDSQSMAVAPQWGEIYSKGAISIFTCKYGHLWQPIFSLFEYERLCKWELHGMTSNHYHQWRKHARLWWKLTLNLWQ